MVQPKPPEMRKESSIQAWQVRPLPGGEAQGVLRLGRGLTSSTRLPSLIRRLWSEASENHLGTLCLLESSEAGALFVKCLFRELEFLTGFNHKF